MLTLTSQKWKIHFDQIPIPRKKSVLKLCPLVYTQLMDTSSEWAKVAMDKRHWNKVTFSVLLNFIDFSLFFHWFFSCEKSMKLKQTGNIYSIIMSRVYTWLHLINNFKEYLWRKIANYKCTRKKIIRFCVYHFTHGKMMLNY